MPAVRFALALVCFLVSLLVLIPAPSLLFFQLKLGGTEFGHWFALVPLVLIFAGRRQSMLDSTSVGLAAIALVLFLSSGFRGMLYASTARGKMDAVFPLPAGSKSSKPFSYLEMWSLGSPPSTETQVIQYGEYNGQDLELDFYPAKDREGAPCVIIMHGGGWDSGDRREFIAFSLRLASKGIAVAAMDYRLAPASTWPAQREDVSAAVDTLKTQADSLGIATNKFILMGRSAGGQIAEAAAVGRDIPGVVGCIAFYSPADMEFAFKYADKKDILNSDKLLRQFLGGTPDEARENYVSASAYARVSAKTVPMLLVHGKKDELVWYQQSHRFAERLKQHNVKHVFLEFPWATHAFDYTLHGPGGQISLWAVEQFVRSVAP